MKRRFASCTENSKKTKGIDVFKWRFRIAKLLLNPSVTPCLLYLRVLRRRPEAPSAWPAALNTEHAEARRHGGNERLVDTTLHHNFTF